ncbi:hypothetical protein GT185_005298 [Salmonella enterica]|nr:hypothetical protein [Salmonella enterica]
MKLPDISVIKKEMGIPSHFKFLGFVICNPHKDDYLAKYAASTEAFSFTTWTPTPEFASKFDSYESALDVFNRLELQGKAEILMSFDWSSQVAACEIPPHYLE